MKSSTKKKKREKWTVFEKHTTDFISNKMGEEAKSHQVLPNDILKISQKITLKLVKVFFVIKTFWVVFKHCEMVTVKMKIQTYE